MRSALILTMLIVASLLAVPLSSATVISASINTSTNVGTVNATSNFVLYYTYPSGSPTSQNLSGTVVWLNATSYLNSSGRQSLENDMNGQHPNQGQNGDVPNYAPVNSAFDPADSNNTTQPASTVHVVNATLHYQIHAFANDSNLTLYRNLTLDLKVTNITRTTSNNTTIIDMSWRAFGVQGALMGHFKGAIALTAPNLGLSLKSNVNTNLDVNTLGALNIGGFGREDNQGGNFLMSTLFGGDGFGNHVMNYDTVNFKVFSVPLNKWARVYNNVTNSTSFYYNTTTNYALNATVDRNGSVYGIELKADPHAHLTIAGDATPTSANELTVIGTRSTVGTGSASLDILIVSAVIAAIVIGVAAVLIRQRMKK